jgi:hypothetical protein
LRRKKYLRINNKLIKGKLFMCSQVGRTQFCGKERQDERQKEEKGSRQANKQEAIERQSLKASKGTKK